MPTPQYNSRIAEGTIGNRQSDNWQLAMTITSRHNSLLRLARAVREGKTNDLIFVEGLRLCEEALRSQLHIEAVIYSEEIVEKDRAARFLEEASAVCERLTQVSEKLLATISYTKTPQGIIALARPPVPGITRFEIRDERPALLVIMHGMNNPVNVGAILRSAEAAGATGVITTTNSADPFSPKALRGAMGSAFRLPIWKDAAYRDVLTWCSVNNIKTVGADVQARSLYTEFDWTTPTALLLGSESTGLSAEDIVIADETVRIGMYGSVESLNVGVAAAILLYEAARQRTL